MTNTASAWLAYELTQSAFAVGLLMFANQIPILVLGPLGGVLGDRLDRRRLLIGLQVVCLLLSASVAVLVMLGHATFGLLLGVATLRGLVNAAEFPTRQSFIIALVDRKEDLANAIALNSSVFNVARLFGPGLAGALIVWVGAAWCFAVDAASFVAAILALSALRVPAREVPSSGAERSPLRDMRDGIFHVRARPGLLAPLLLVPVMAFSGFAPTILAPVFAREVFSGDARSLGWMLSAVGAGALASGLMLGARRDTVGLEEWVWRGSLLTGFALIGFALAPGLWTGLAFLVANGMGVVLSLAGSNTLLQARVEDGMRGRVMGLFVMGQGLYPIGCLVSGSLASLAGPRWATAILAVVALAAGLVFRSHCLRLRRASCVSS